MVSLSWPQVNTWRLAQHHLLQRAEPGQMPSSALARPHLGQDLGHARDLALAAVG
jgi:hypothetical protein